MSGRELLPLHFNEPHLEIGGFKALDYFGDGSFYVLDVPGHLAGHICGLARVTPTTFVYLGGDVVHHAGMLRPTAKLHRQFPCPDELLAATRTSVAAVHFPSADSAGQFNLAARMVPMLDVVEDGAYEDPSAARKSIAKLADFDANDDVFILFAHDTSLLDALGPLPVSLNDWKAKGWKEQVIWSFLDEGNPSFRFNEKMASTN
ncbi:hypothetical protein C8F04DRAFT_689123 [Mycena alexandri]|uniref:Metallo-beta-lactamase domain-containing protein n=1 Tax=Mycena alexandri TaxID=1745969 RepID=A0AAD6TF93_9AGAR|nr:hypothetical protein C8F04DRAFT_689123 [Mycena alexandri]